MKAKEKVHLFSSNCGVQRAEEETLLPKEDINSSFGIPTSPATAKSRRDLQGIRGIAISAVVLFHFFPNQFPNGHIGVDQFFVLSGFLMSMVTEREKRFGGREIASFYYRRLKRIVPLYLLVILGCMVISEACLFGYLHPTNWDSLYYASVFMTNIKATDSIREYHEMISKAADFFTHTWSIAAEMQFYIVFPLLFLIYKSIYTPLSKLFLLIVGISSLIFHCLLPDRQAFNLIHARIWQFVIGILVHQLDKTSTESETTSKYSSLICHRICLVLNILISLWMFIPIPPLFLRISTTVFTAGLILFNTKSDSSCVLTTRCLTYVGDISYSLYLVHWPIYIIIQQNSFYSSIEFGVVVAVLVSVFLTETFEKVSMRASKRSVLYLIICFYAAIAVSILTVRSSETSQMERTWIAKLFTPTCKTPLQETTGLCDLPITSAHLTKEEMLKLNKRLSLDDIYLLFYPKCSYRNSYGNHIGPWEWCDLPSEWNLKGTKKHKILVLGNSYAANQGRVIYEMCKGPDVEIKIFALAGCEVFTKTEELWHCKNSSKVYLKAIREFKPDSLFILPRYLKTMQLPRSTEQSTADKYVLEGANVLRNFSRFVSDKIFILHAIPRPVLDFESQYLQTITKPHHIDPTTIINKHPNLRLAREILERTVKSCRKCALIDYSPLFTINGTFRFFDEQYKIFNLNGYWHFTPLGLHKLRPFYKNICNNITNSNKQGIINTLQ